MEELSSDLPTDINPYHVLSLPIDADPSDVKTAYKKLALKHHPDKVAPSDKITAHNKFQEIAFAYAILSSPSRRARYDNTGSTSESLDPEDEGFNWSDFFRQQWADLVTAQNLDNFKSEYQHSAKEELDVLHAYNASNGHLNHVFETVMLCNPLDDEARFRGYIDAAISTGKVKSYHAYTHEDPRAAGKRKRAARKEAKQAEAYAKEIGVHDKLFGDKAKKKNKNQPGNDEAGLAELVQQRAKGRADTFFKNFEAKYAGKEAGKKRKAEPSEAAFQETAKRIKKRNAAMVIEKEEEPTDPDTESAWDDIVEDDDEEEENVVEKEEDTIPPPKHKKKPSPKKQQASPVKKQAAAPKKKKHPPPPKRSKKTQR